MTESAAAALPRRLQLSRAAGWRIADHSTKYAIVDRRSAFGNPWTIRPFGRKQWDVLRNNAWPTLGTFDTNVAARRFAVEQFHRWLTDDAFAATLPEMGRGWILEHLHDLCGRDLFCWCPLPDVGEPDHCHGAPLLDLANNPT